MGVMCALDNNNAHRLKAIKMKVYIVWWIDKQTKREIILDIYQDSEKALARVKKEKELIHKRCQTSSQTVVMEMKYVLL